MGHIAYLRLLISINTSDYILTLIRSKQDVFVKLNAPDNGQFQRRPRSQGQIF